MKSFIYKSFVDTELIDLYLEICFRKTKNLVRHFLEPDYEKEFQIFTFKHKKNSVCNVRQTAHQTKPGLHKNPCMIGYENEEFVALILLKE